MVRRHVYAANRIQIVNRNIPEHGLLLVLRLFLRLLLRLLLRLGLGGGGGGFLRGRGRVLFRVERLRLCWAGLFRAEGGVPAFGSRSSAAILVIEVDEGVEPRILL